MPIARLKLFNLPGDPDDFAQLQHALNKLPGIIADCLSCFDPGGQLAETDVEVEVATLGALETMRYHAELRIEAMNFPSRVANKDARAQAIMDSFAPLLPKRYGTRHVWLVLVDAAFVDKTSK